MGKRSGGSFEDDISSAMVRAGQVFRMLSGADDGFNSQPLQMCAVHLVDTIIGHKEAGFFDKALLKVTTKEKAAKLSNAKLSA